jgi:hypothetical protein
VLCRFVFQQTQYYAELSIEFVHFAKAVHARVIFRPSAAIGHTGAALVASAGHYPGQSISHTEKLFRCCLDKQNIRRWK